MIINGTTMVTHYLDENSGEVKTLNGLYRVPSADARFNFHVFSVNNDGSVSLVSSSPDMANAIHDQSFFTNCDSRPKDVTRYDILDMSDFHNAGIGNNLTL